MRLNDRINVTPLADVMLVLLIIFMVVTPLIGPGVDVKTPEAEHPTEHPGEERAIVVSMRADGSLYLGRNRVEDSELDSQLAAKISGRTEKVVYLKASELLDYGVVLAMMERCRIAGVTEVALLTREKRRSPLG
jgi:biopolymer transport protein TolR